MVYVYLPQQHLVERLLTEFTSRSVYKYRFAVSLCFVLYFLLVLRACRVLSRKIILGGKLVLRAVLVAPGGGCERGVCPLPSEDWKLSPF